MADRWRRLYECISYSDKLDRVSDKAALLYTWMIAHTDDWGRMQGEASYLRKKVVPGRKWNEKQVLEALEQLEREKLIIVGHNEEHPGKLFLEITNALEFQKPGKGKHRKEPEVPKITQRVREGVRGCLDQTRPDQTRPDQTKEQGAHSDKPKCAPGANELFSNPSPKAARSRKRIALDDLSARLVKFEGCDDLLHRFFAMADQARKTGMSESKAHGILDDFVEMYEENRAVFSHALKVTLETENFDWSRPNLTGYVRMVYNSTVRVGLPDKHIEKTTLAMKVAQVAYENRHKILNKYRRADGTWSPGLIKAMTVEAWNYPKECACLIKAFRGWRKWGDGKEGAINDKALRAGLLQRAKELFKDEQIGGRDEH